MAGGCQPAAVVDARCRRTPTTCWTGSTAAQCHSRQASREGSGGPAWQTGYGFLPSGPSTGWTCRRRQYRFRGRPPPARRRGHGRGSPTGSRGVPDRSDAILAAKVRLSAVEEGHYRVLDNRPWPEHDTGVFEAGVAKHEAASPEAAILRSAIRKGRSRSVPICWAGSCCDPWRVCSAFQSEATCSAARREERS